MTKRVGRRSLSPTNKPPGSYQPPYSQPPTLYPYPPRNRSAEIITISLLVAAFMLLGLGTMLWVVQARLAFGPTPTPTPTSTALVTATPDFSATRVAEDFLTQQAYQMALLGTLTPTPLDPTPEYTPDFSDITPKATSTALTVRLPDVNSPASPTPPAAEVFATPDQELLPQETPTPNTVVLPIVVDSSPLATPTPAQVAEVPTVPPVPTATETPTPLPTETPTATPPLPVDTPSPTPTETIALPAPTPTQPYAVTSLQGFVQNQDAALRLGPSNVYTTVNTLAPNTRVSIIGRSPSGEWTYICCVENQANIQPAWVRQAFVRPGGNPHPSGAPEEFNPNDVRRLPLLQAPTILPGAIPTPIPPGPNDFPLYRYDSHGQGRVSQLPIPPLNPAWPAVAQAGLRLGSPIAVLNSNVLVGSEDNHLYSFDRLTGSQRWRQSLCEGGCRQVTLAPMTYDNEIFLADQNRTIWSLWEQNGTSAILWRVAIDQPALTSFNVYSATLFIATGEGENYNLLALHRDNGAELWRRGNTGSALRYPIIGDQLVYAAHSFIAAFDVNNGELVWENRTVQNIPTNPVYGSPGPNSLAELYVADGSNRLFALDANTGIELWNIDNGEGVTSLALNESTLFVAGNGYVKAFSRQNRNQLWRTPLFGGQVMGGPLVDTTRVLVVTESGNVYLLDNQNGSSIAGQTVTSFLGGAPALSGPWIFMPGVDGRVHDLLGSQ